MGTITMSGFNNIDWNQVLNAVMQQEQQPLKTMQARYSELQARSTAYSTLATKLGALLQKASDLKSSSTFGGRTASSSDATVVKPSADAAAMAGSYSVTVTALARAQVTQTSSTWADKDTTAVATGGSLTINGKTVTLTGATTLQQLAAAINDTEGIGVAATVVQAAVGNRLVLTGSATGAANAFTITNSLSGSSVVFSATNAVDASDADLTINNVRVTNTTNTVSDAIPGVTLSLLKTTATPTMVTVGEDPGQTKTKLQAFATAYNDLVAYFKSQSDALKNGVAGNLGVDPLLQSLRRQLSGVILGSYDVGGAYRNLAEIGIEFQRDGTLSLNSATYDSVATSHQADIESLLGGTSTVSGAFAAISTAISNYTQAGGLVPDAQKRLSEQMQKLNEGIGDEQERLALRKATLQKEYAAADQAMATLNAQTASLSGLNSGYRLY